MIIFIRIMHPNSTILYPHTWILPTKIKEVAWNARKFSRLTNWECSCVFKMTSTIEQTMSICWMRGTMRCADTSSSYACVCSRGAFLYIYVCINKYACMHVCMHVCIHVCVHVCIWFICSSILLFIFIYLDDFICVWWI